MDKKIFDCLAKKHRLTSNSSEFLKDLLETLCNAFPANYGAKFEELEEEIPCLISSIALQIPLYLSCATLFDVFKNYFQELLKDGKDVQSVKLCKVVCEVVKSCPLTWFLQIGENAVKNIEISHMEKPKGNTASLLLFLLKSIDLMSLNSEEIRSHQRLRLFPRVLVLCRAILRKICVGPGVPDVILRNLELSVLRKVACDSVMASIQQIGKQHWVSEISRKVALDFLDFISSRCGCNGVADLLSGSDVEISNEAAEFQERKIFPNGLLGNVLKCMKHFMTKDKLVDSPVAIHVLVWSVLKVKHPFLGAHVSMVMPPLLLLVDDYRVYNRVTGIRALGHVVDNTNAAELCWYGRAEVIYEALHHRIHNNEPEVLEALHPCLLKVLKVIEPSPKKPVAGRKMNKCDLNFQIILSSMEFESKIALRRAYCKHLVKFIDYMGITVLRHFKCLMRVVFRYLEIPDGTTEEWRLAMLDVLKSIITNAWPRVSAHANDILECLMKLIIDISISCSDVQLESKQAMFVKIEGCLLFLLLCCGELVRKQLEEMTTGLGHTEAENLICRTLDTYKLQIEEGVSTVAI